MNGIKADKSNVEVGNNVKFSVVSIDPIKNEVVKNRQKVVNIKRKIWNYTIDQNGVLRWENNLENVANFTQNTDNFTYNFTQGGEYQIFATDALNAHKASVDVYVNGWDNGILAPTKELSRAYIKTDKTSYNKGDEISTNVSSVLKDGIALITLENNGVKKFQRTKISNNSASAKFKLDFDFDGLYVVASVVRVSDFGILPFRTYNKIYVNSDISQKAMDLKIKAPKFSKSNSNFNVVIKTAPNSDVSLFAVNFGVLNITDQKPRNPLEFFSALKPKSMLDYDIYSMISNFKKDSKALSFGGDTMMLARMRMDKFASPINDKNIKTFITMQTARTNKDGETKFSIFVPQNFDSKINLVANSDKQ